MSNPQVTARVGSSFGVNCVLDSAKSVGVVSKENSSRPLSISHEFRVSHSYASHLHQDVLFADLVQPFTTAPLDSLTSLCIIFGRSDSGTHHTLFGGETESTSGLLQRSLRSILRAPRMHDGLLDVSVSLMHYDGGLLYDGLMKPPRRIPALSASTTAPMNSRDDYFRLFAGQVPPKFVDAHTVVLLKWRTSHTKCSSLVFVIVNPDSNKHRQSADGSLDTNDELDMFNLSQYILGLQCGLVARTTVGITGLLSNSVMSGAKIHNVNIILHLSGLPPDDAVKLLYFGVKSVRSSIKPTLRDGTAYGKKHACARHYESTVVSGLIDEIQWLQKQFIESQTNRTQTESRDTQVEPAETVLPQYVANDNHLPKEEISVSILRSQREAHVRAFEMQSDRFESIVQDQDRKIRQLESEKKQLAERAIQIESALNMRIESLEVQAEKYRSRLASRMNRKVFVHFTRPDSSP